MMNDMIADILKKAIPPEVMAMLTPEKMQEIGDRINATVKDWNDRLDRIEATQQRILERLPDDSNSDRSGAIADASSGSGSKPD